MEGILAWSFGILFAVIGVAYTSTHQPVQPISSPVPFVYQSAPTEDTGEEIKPPEPKKKTQPVQQIQQSQTVVEIPPIEVPTPPPAPVYINPITNTQVSTAEMQANEVARQNLIAAKQARINAIQQQIDQENNLIHNDSAGADSCFSNLPPIQFSQGREQVEQTYRISICSAKEQQVIGEEQILQQLQYALQSAQNIVIPDYRN